MKHAFQWLLAALCLLVVGNVSVMADDEEVKTVPIPIGNKMSYHSPTVLNSIKQGKSVFMCGEDDNMNISHAWIIDGYKCVRTTRIESTRPSGSLLWTNDTIVSEQYYNHINWGWDGSCNGYFFVSVLEPLSPTFIDNGVEIKNTYDFDFDTDLYIYPYIY